MLPPFNEAGDLPPGVYRTGLSEILARFGAGSLEREAAAARLERVYAIALATGHLARFVVFGSFVTDKPSPHDVDIVMLMNDGFDVGELAGEAAILFDHAAADAHFGCSVFWVRKLAALGGEDDMIEGWQMKREGGFRGIVEIVADQ